MVNTPAITDEDGGSRTYDVIVVGAGPNGLAAAITLTRAGCSVLVVEGTSVPGGGTHTEPLTLPGFVHDVCSAVHPLACVSPFFRSLPLAEHGLEWITPPVAVVHAFDDGTVAVMERSIETTAQHLGVDGPAYRALMKPLVEHWDQLYRETLGPVLHLPRHPILLAHFGLRALPPITWLARWLFKGEQARALLAGIAAHATLPLNHPPSTAIALILGVAGHVVGWPISRGGSRAIATALVSYFRSLGGEMVFDTWVRSLADLPSARAFILDVTPYQLLQLVGDRLPFWYRKQLTWYRYGLGTFKVDWALAAPIPWRSAECTQTATVHLGGSLDELEASRRQEWRGQSAERPFIILAQPTLFDPSRAPEGKHVAWAYCHVPNGSPVDMTDRIERQIERFAPGFRDRILARHTMGPAEFERRNPNLVGGDINGGEATLRQLIFRPTVQLVPYTTPLRNVFICSSSTPPGGGVHGMCGYHAAQAVLRHLL
jgi:phytoene dehydrogenase-like protein